MFPVPFTKGSARLPNIFFSTVYPSTAVLVDYSTLLQYGVLVLRMYQVKACDQEKKLWFSRNIREAIFIRVNDPSLNRNIGKFQLPHIWDEVLAKSPELHLKLCHIIWHGGNPKPTNITNGGNHKPTNHIYCQ